MGSKKRMRAKLSQEILENILGLDLCTDMVAMYLQNDHMLYVVCHSDFQQLIYMVA